MKKIIFIVAALVVGGIMFGALDSIHPFGEPISPVMDDHYISNVQADRAANNVVTSIVFDYRGFDTLGEATVLFAAVSSVVAIFRKGGNH